MVGDVVAVAMHRPVEIFLEPVRMPVLGDHVEVVLDRLEHRRGVVHHGHHGPNGE